MNGNDRREVLVRGWQCQCQKCQISQIQLGTKPRFPKLKEIDSHIYVYYERLYVVSDRRDNRFPWRKPDVEEEGGPGFRGGGASERASMGRIADSWGEVPHGTDRGSKCVTTDGPDGGLQW